MLAQQSFGKHIIHIALDIRLWSPLTGTLASA